MKNMNINEVISSVTEKKEEKLYEDNINTSINIKESLGESKSI